MAAAKVTRGRVIELRCRYEDGAVSRFVVRTNDNGAWRETEDRAEAAAWAAARSVRGEK